MLWVGQNSCFVYQGKNLNNAFLGCRTNSHFFCKLIFNSQPVVPLSCWYWKSTNCCWQGLNRMQTAGRASPIQQRAVLHFKNETNLLQRSAVVSAPPRLGVRAATEKLLILEKHTFVFLNRPSPLLSLFLAESPSAESGWACEGVKFLTAAPGLASCFYFIFASAYGAEVAVRWCGAWSSGP